MINDKAKKLKKSEIIIIIIIIIISLGLVVFYKFFNQTDNTVAQISYNGNIVQTIDLSTSSNKVFRLEENDKVGFEIKDKKISFVDVSCPDKICENVGFINTVNSVAICLPNRTTVKIVGNGDIDAIVS